MSSIVDIARIDTPAVTLQVAQAVREAAASHGVSQEALAEATGIPLATLLRRIDGQTAFNVTEVSAIADCLGTDFLRVAVCRLTGGDVSADTNAATLHT